MKRSADSPGQDDCQQTQLVTLNQRWSRASCMVQACHVHARTAVASLDVRTWLEEDGLGIATCQGAGDCTESTEGGKSGLTVRLKDLLQWLSDINASASPASPIGEGCSLTCCLSHACDATRVGTRRVVILWLAREVFRKPS